MNSPPTKDILYVGLQGILFLLYLIPLFRATFDLLFPFAYVGLAIAVLGVLVILLALLQLNRNLTPFPTPKEGGNLIETGLYKYIRHPIYTGIILTTIGYGLYQGSYWRIGIGVALWGLFYFKSKYEEGMLRKHYPGYSDYASRTWRFFPFI